MADMPAKAIQNCLDCPEHCVINDNDPHDWFCDDDVAVVCKLTPNPNQDMASIYQSDHSPHKAIAISCRPYNTRHETKIPDWCPLNLYKPLEGT